jgi:hypothetical protein
VWAALTGPGASQRQEDRIGIDPDEIPTQEQSCFEKLVLRTQATPAWLRSFVQFHFDIRSTSAGKNASPESGEAGRWK